MLKDRIKKLISLIENTEIEEIEVSSFWGAQKIRLSKSKSYQETGISNRYSDISQNNDILSENNKSEIAVEPKTPDVNLPASPIPVSEEEDYSDESKFRIVTAPLVGTFYSCPKPGDPPYINMGESVDKGMTICIIEAMKIFNDIESEFSGKLVEVYVDDGSPVEYGQELFVLKIENV